ncbi:MAG TPA: hypothetical protein VHN14_14170 [Kofleriaceae bacterium]|nr:hypothetical protein [Kofleriaceae bacterium]
MSAASAPKPDEAPEPTSDAEGWALLDSLRRRLDEQVAQGRKTAAQVTQLADSIAGLVEQQRRRSLWLNVNSFVAYLMFTVLCGAGCYLLYVSRAHELSSARDRAIGERDAAVRTADDATVRAVAREAAGTKAWEVYQLLEAGKRSEAVAKLEALRDQPLSKTERAVLAARVHDTQVMEVDAALKAAVASFKAGRPGDVIKPLEAALTGESPGTRAAAIHYYLGVAYARTELDKAITHLQAAIAGDVDQDDARFQLASVLDRSAAYAQARAEYDRFATAHPQSPLAVFAMRRSATLARLPAAAPLGVALPPGAGGAPGSVLGPASAAAPPSGTRAASSFVPPGATPPATGASPALNAPGKAPPPVSQVPPGGRATIPALRPAAGAVAGPGTGAAGAVAAPSSGTPAARAWPKPATKPVGPNPPTPGPASNNPSDPAAKPSMPAKPPAAPPASPPAANPASPPGDPAAPAAESLPVER